MHQYLLLFVLGLLVSTVDGLEHVERDVNTYSDICNTGYGVAFVHFRVF